MEVDGAIQQSDAAVAAIGKGEASLALCKDDAAWRTHRTPIEMRDLRQFLRAICPRWQAPRVLMIVPGVPTERFGMDRRPTKALHLQNGQSRA